MRTGTTRSVMTGGEGGGSDEDDGSHTSRRVYPMKGRNGSWLMVAILSLVIMQQPSAAVVAAPTSIPINPNLGGSIDIPLGEKATPVEKGRRNLEEEEESEVIHHKTDGYDIYRSRSFNGTLLRRSDKTMAAFKKFIDHNCREKDLDNLNTFFNWEQDQFAKHLKTKVFDLLEMKKGDSNRQKLVESEKDRMKTLIDPHKDVSDILKSICPMTDSLLDEMDLKRKTDNDRLENEIVNAVFASMYRRQASDGAIFRTSTMRRKTLEELKQEHLQFDEKFTKEITRILRR